MSFIENIKGAFGANADADRGSLVETVLIIAGMAVVAILVVTWIGGAIAGQAANVSGCIAGANGNDAAELQSNCTNDTHGVANSISNSIEENKGGRF